MTEQIVNRVSFELSEREDGTIELKENVEINSTTHDQLRFIFLHVYQGVVENAVFLDGEEKKGNRYAKTAIN